MTITTLTETWLRFCERWGVKRVVAMTWLLIVGVSALLMHLLFITRLNHSALLYMLVPYSLAVVIIWFRNYSGAQTVKQKYWKHLVSTIAVFLATSIVLREGFICVIFFLPIYLVLVSIAFLYYLIKENKTNKISKKYSSLIPMLVVALSLEGTIEPLTFPRDNQAVVSQTTNLSVEDIKQNMARPFKLEGEGHWMISMFPMPYRIDAGSLNEGDVHTAYIRYHRWFVTNTHEGSSELLIKRIIDTPTSTKITTEVLSDTTYFSSYLEIHGTEITLTPLIEGGTQIDLTINYQRKLDPAWYFHPLQKFGVSKMADSLINDIMVRGFEL